MSTSNHAESGTRPLEAPTRIADYPNIPDHSDLRGFSYRAPTYRESENEKFGKIRPGLWDFLARWVKGWKHGN